MIPRQRSRRKFTEGTPSKQGRRTPFHLSAYVHPIYALRFVSYLSSPIRSSTCPPSGLTPSCLPSLLLDPVVWPCLVARIFPAKRLEQRSDCPVSPLLSVKEPRRKLVGSNGCLFRHRDEACEDHLDERLSRQGDPYINACRRPRVGCRRR